MLNNHRYRLLRYVLLLLVLLLPLGCANFLPAENVPAGQAGRPPKEAGAPPPSEAPPPVSAIDPVEINDTARLTGLEGIYYTQAGKAWSVGKGGQLLDHGQALSGPVLSPDGSQVLFSTENDLWLLKDSQTLNLTNTPGIKETGYFFHPVDPQVIYFISVPDGEGETGYLTTIHSDGSGSQVLDGEHRTAYASPSPDGQRIAYGWDSGWIYTAGEGPQAFDPADYQQGNFFRLGNPSWSPDGLQLAWIVTGGVKGHEASGVAVFNLVEGAGYLHFVFAAGSDEAGYPGPVVWSPDGLWLAFHHPNSKSPESEGLWVIASDGRSDLQFHLGVGFSNPVWSPDGQYLAFNRTGGTGDSLVWLTQPGTWDLFPTELPAGAVVYDWR